MLTNFTFECLANEYNGRVKRPGNGPPYAGKKEMHCGSIQHEIYGIRIKRKTGNYHSMRISSSSC